MSKKTTNEAVGLFNYDTCYHVERKNQSGLSTNCESVPSSVIRTLKDRNDSSPSTHYHPADNHKGAPHRVSSSSTLFTHSSKTNSFLEEQSESVGPVVGHEHDHGRNCYLESSKDFMESGAKSKLLAPLQSKILQAPTLPECPASSSIHLGKYHLRSICNILVTIYSTALSGLWLCLATVQPRYGQWIGPGGSIALSTASTVFALLAKTIEIATVTVFLTFLGQVLTRRSLRARGFSIADMAMRVWIVQPGYILTNWQNVRYVGITIIGLGSLLASLSTLLFTTASSTLVSPHLSYDVWETKMIYGFVEGSFANPAFIKSSCQSPITTEIDPIYSGETCLDLSFADLSFRDFDSYLQLWSTVLSSGGGVPQGLPSRPQASSSVFTDVAVQGSWVQTKYSNLSANYQRFGRFVNNVTLSMPHAGIYYASQDIRNGIPQPAADASGWGEYALRAPVVSPSSNVLCVNLNESELSPLVYTTWPGALYTNVTGEIPGQKLPVEDFEDLIQLEPGESYLNSTIVDDLFEWGSRYGRQPPVFPMYPIDYNSVTNTSVPNSDSIYVLLKSATISDYTICQIRGFLSPDCSTGYNATLSSHSMKPHCEQSKDDPDTSYRNSFLLAQPEASRSPKAVGEINKPQQSEDKIQANSIPISRDLNYKDILAEWSLSVNLNGGIENANTSSARLLAQLIPTASLSIEENLSSRLPSIAEGLSVLSCSMLMKSSINTTFYHYWNHSTDVLNPGIYEGFNATLRTQQYASGAVAVWQGIFYPVLIFVFVGNALCLLYFITHMNLVSDIIDPQTSFTLAINSPYSKELSGSCSRGPKGEQLIVDWHLKKDEQEHYYLQAGGDEILQRGGDLQRRTFRWSPDGWSRKVS